MATGERKWASSSTRRGGMTFLGKVSVPKPMNLPSQKLENHGKDPNVEIIPKGTLSWGNRSSSPASNPWGSSQLSFHTDNGRPSSGGSGTRPSTGGSEKAYESNSNAGGSNSRPSSASGSLTSNQASGTTLRPQSADNRPGSSQLSRFAESSTENLGLWAAAGSGDSVRQAHSKSENFSLASGDFPTLGSEKEDPPKNAHSSPRGGYAVDNARKKSDNVNHARRDNSSYEDGRRPIMEKWHVDALHQNPNMPGPLHFAPRHDAPVGNPSVGVWYRGSPGGPPYVPPGAPPYERYGAPPYGPSGAPPYGPSNIPPYESLMGPGGFPVEYPYYQPLMPAPSLGSSQPVPHHGAGPRGVHHPNNGEMYRPSNPDGHFLPGMPMRPGFFPGPVPYEGYYPLPIGYCGPNDRDIRYLRPSGALAFYDSHSTLNAAEHVDSQSASGRHPTPENPTGLDHGTSGDRHNPHEQYKVFLNQHGQDHVWGDTAATNNSQFEKGYHHRPSSHEKDQGTVPSGEKTYSRRTSNEGEPIQVSHNHGGSQFHGRERSTDEAKSTKGFSNVKKNMSEKSSSSKDVAALRDSGLINKIEGVNAKARGTDGKQDTSFYSNRDDRKSSLHVISNDPHVNNDSTTHFKSHGGGIIDPTSSHGILAVGGSNSSRKYSNSGPQIRTGYHGKGNPDLLETGRHKNAHNGRFSTTLSSSKSDPVYLEGQYQQSNMVLGKFESSLDGNEVVLDSGSEFDPIDIQMQLAKKKEIAMQRAIKLQREKEERIKEQKSNAQAKLEELNRRTKLLESSTEKCELGTEKAEIVTEKPEIVTGKADKTLTSGKIDAKQREVHSELLSSAPALLISNSIVIGTRTLDPQLQIPKDGHHKIDAIGEPQHYGGKSTSLKPKNKGYKDKLNFQHEKVAIEKINRAAGDSLKYENEAGEEVFNKVTMLAEPEVHHRAKSGKSGKNKHRVEETSSSVGIKSAAPKNSDVVKALVEGGKLQLPKMAEATHGQHPVNSGDTTTSIEPHASQLREEAQGRSNNHSRHQTQSSRKQSRNQQGIRAVEKTHGSDTVVWAPVKQLNKEAIGDSSLQVQVVSEEAGDYVGKFDHPQSNTRNKRAEIERYVPKHVAKELAQQGGGQQTTSPATNLTLSAATKVETADEIKNVDNDHNRQEQAQRTWRQRDSAEAFYRKSPNYAPYSVVSRVNHVPYSREAQEEKKFSDGWSSPDEWNLNVHKAPDPSVPNLKNQESFNRGTRLYNKVTRNTGTFFHDRDHRKAQAGRYVGIGHIQVTISNNDERNRPGTRNIGTYIHDQEHRKGQAGKDVGIGHIQVTIYNNDERDRTSSHKEHHHEGEHPSSSYKRTTQHESFGGVHQNSGRENTRFVKKGPATQCDHFQSKDVNTPYEASNRPYAPANPQHDQRERRTATPQVGSYSSNPNTHAQPEQSHPVEHQHERPHSSSGIRKHSDQNIRKVRALESQGDWKSFEHDWEHHNSRSGRGRDRDRHGNSHYEYKPKGQSQPSSANTDGGTN